MAVQQLLVLRAEREGKRPLGPLQVALEVPLRLEPLAAREDRPRPELRVAEHLPLEELPLRVRLRVGGSVKRPLAQLLVVKLEQQPPQVQLDVRDARPLQGQPVAAHLLEVQPRRAQHPVVGSGKPLREQHQVESRAVLLLLGQQAARGGRLPREQHLAAHRQEAQLLQAPPEERDVKRRLEQQAAAPQ